MKNQSMRRLYMRKNCPISEISLIGPEYSEQVLVHEVSLGGFKLEFSDEVPESLMSNARVRLILPADYPLKSVIAGGQIVWISGNACGVKLIYTNCSVIAYQKVVDQFHQTVNED
ncbi:MAG: PilZ domain-containing protein [SAR324 cluster bacterium]|nr:PilZ domain-containing protein [SAR324 cluster bacterium]